MDGPEQGSRLAGLGGVLAGVVSAAVVAVDGTARLGGAFTGGQPTIYGPGQAALALGLLAAGLVLLMAPGRAVCAALLVVTGLGSAQLAGTGLVAHRRWPLFWGCCSTEAVTAQTLMRALALVMAAACAATAVSCVVVAARDGYLRWSGVDLSAIVAFASSLVIGVAGPRLVAGRWDDWRELAAWALMYALPFAAALALSPLLPRAAALAVTAAVAGSALVAGLGDAFLERTQPWGDGLPLVLAAAAAVAATRTAPRPTNGVAR